MEHFHAGEQAMQTAVGLRDRISEIGRRAIRDHMPDQHRAFFEMLPTIHLGAVDADGHPCAVTRWGAPGFLQSPTPQSLTMTSEALPGEPEDLHLGLGDKVSIVGLQYATRRRNRLNATISDVANETLTLRVDQSFGNCPKYIQAHSELTSETSKLDVRKAAQLDTEDQRRIAQADTMFLASRAPELTDKPEDGVDINHRGGRPGYIQVLSPTEIEFPDYIGNNFFQSLGNISLDPRVGLQIVDLKTGDLTNLKGRARVITGDTENLPPPFTQRRVRVEISEVVYAAGALPIRFAFEDYARELPEPATA